MLHEVTLKRLDELADRLEEVPQMIRSWFNTDECLENLQSILEDCASAMESIRKLESLQK